MGCFGCLNEVGAADDQDPNLIIDVEKELAEAAWKMFRISYGKIERRFLKRKRYRIDVPMNYYHFEEVDHIMEGRTPRLPGSTGLGKNGEKNLMAGKSLANSDKTSPGQIGLQTEFNNDTNEKQTYTFHFEKVRTAAVEVSYQRGYSIGAKANFSIGLPKVLADGSIGMEIEKRLEVTKATGQRFEESLKTTATSDIVVSEKSRYTASVVMEERQLLANFKVIMEMSIPAGIAPIYITDTKTGEIVFVRTVSNLPRIFKKFKTGVEQVLDNGRVRNDAVRFTVEGIIDGIQLSTHKINLFSSPSISAEEVEKMKLGMSQDGEKKQIKDGDEKAA